MHPHLRQLEVEARQSLLVKEGVRGNLVSSSPQLRRKTLILRLKLRQYLLQGMDL